MMMQVRWLPVVVIMMLAVLVSGCEKEKKSGKVEVTGHEIVLRQDGPNSYVLDAKGKVKNIGDVDVKNLIVTGYCRSCQEIFTNGKWFVSEYEKTPEQKDIISYLTPGNEENFAFKGIAFFFPQSGEKPESLPDNIEIIVESFDVME